MVNMQFGKRETEKRMLYFGTLCLKKNFFFKVFETLHLECVYTDLHWPI